MYKTDDDKKTELFSKLIINDYNSYFLASSRIFGNIDSIRKFSIAIVVALLGIHATSPSWNLADIAFFPIASFFIYEVYLRGQLELLKHNVLEVEKVLKQDKSYSEICDEYVFGNSRFNTITNYSKLGFIMRAFSHKGMWIWYFLLILSLVIITGYLRD